MAAVDGGAEVRSIRFVKQHNAVAQFPIPFAIVLYRQANSERLSFGFGM
jgi:hypothetical protein